MKNVENGNLYCMEKDIKQKLCSGCGTVKVFQMFYKDKAKSHGISTYCKSCVKTRVRENYTKNKVHHKKKHQEWVSKNRDKVTKYGIIYRKANKEKRNLYEKERCKKDPNFKILRNLRSRLRSALKGNFKKGSAVTDLGCSIEFLIKHLESKFKDGMSWENYGFKGWHIDHIRPLSSFDLTQREELKKACHYSNLQPLWAIDNLKKNDKLGE